MPYQIELEAFKGPFDLLIHLIEKNEINIYDIPMAKITKQYLEYLGRMPELDLEVTSQFLVMASRLTVIKARMLLPRDTTEENEEDPRDELVSHLIEYKKFKEAADYLQEQLEQPVQTYPRTISEEYRDQLINNDAPLEGLSLRKLVDAFKKAIETAAFEEDQVTNVQLDQITVEDKMEEITKKLLFNNSRIEFGELFHSKSTVREFVTTFLALLELCKNKFIIIEQNTLFGSIYIYRDSDVKSDSDDFEV